MKLLLFSDLHCQRKAAAALVGLADQVNVVVGAGDFGNMRRGIEQAVQMLSPIANPAVVTPGNAESVDELRDACQKWPSAVVVHGESTTIEGVVFFGLGGAVPVTPFGSWSYDFTESQAEELLKDCPQGSVLVAHSPPRGACDRSSQGESLGSTAVREIILARRPRLVVCGHIHGSAGVMERIGEVPIVNAGPAGVLWDLAADQPLALE